MKTARILAAAAALAFAAPTTASAQSAWPIDPASYVDVSMITIDDGHSLEYANHLAGMWRSSQDFAKSQGWISDYQIWINEFPRDGEPDVYLVTWFPSFASPEESKKRDAAYLAHAKATEEQLQAASGKRAEYRHLSGSMLFRQYTWAK
ncbi:hypothetical protein B2G71_15895 [Novosphingobium sp. PC22D]|uniref:hypothetical protein n=1 Tax=Novosphingobium sp. PC22D TaxID=1962403 RepID=UPI000BF1E697|nr:hypothetical protein [Novosphingobium sp. PC22D]PEQ11607.1 hypothetical protein B2G71_15895 [Novosphingobium sp. PC22D]